MGFSRNTGWVKKERRAGGRGECQWVESICFSCTQQSLFLRLLKVIHTESPSRLQLQNTQRHDIAHFTRRREWERGWMNEWMNEQGGEFQAFLLCYQPTIALTIKLPVFRLVTVFLWEKRCTGQKMQNQSRAQKKTSKNPNHEICLGMWQTESACVDFVCAWVCEYVWPLTSDSVWHLGWQAPVTGVPVWADRSQTTWAGAYIYVHVHC